MSLADVIQPAIDMARQGYVATPALISNIMNIYDVMIKSEELTEILSQRRRSVAKTG